MSILTTAARCLPPALFVLASAFSTHAPATPVTLNFKGVVTQETFDPFDPLGSRVEPGSVFYSYLNFDTTAADAAASPNLGSYTLSGFPYGFAAVVGSVLFPLMHTVNISVVDGAGGGADSYSVFASEGSPGGLGDFFSLSILMQDDTGQAFGSDALPGEAPDPRLFSSASFDLAGQYTNLDGDFIQYEIQGNLVALPEPAGPSLIGAALLACAAAMRRRRALPSATGSQQP